MMIGKGCRWRIHKDLTEDIQHRIDSVCRDSSTAQRCTLDCRYAAVIGTRSARRAIHPFSSRTRQNEYL